MTSSEVTRAETSPTSTTGPRPAADAPAVIAVTYGLVRFGYGLYLPIFTARFGLPAAVAGGLAAGSFAAYRAVALLA